MDDSKKVSIIFLIQAMKKVQNQGNGLTKHIRAVADAVETLEEAIDEIFAGLDDQLDDQVFSFLNIPKLDSEGKLSGGRALDILSNYFYQENVDFETTVTEFFKEIDKLTDKK